MRNSVARIQSRLRGSPAGGGGLFLGGDLMFGRASCGTVIDLARRANTKRLPGNNRVMDCASTGNHRAIKADEWLSEFLPFLLQSVVFKGVVTSASTRKSVIKHFPESGGE
jgi:hypothetical protein